MATLFTFIIRLFVQKNLYKLAMSDKKASSKVNKAHGKQRLVLHECDASQKTTKYVNEILYHLGLPRINNS